MPRSVRPAFSALWQLDLALADVVSTSSDARLGAIRLAWWRERLDDLDQGVTPPSEPRLQAVYRDLVARGVHGHDLSMLEDAWLPALERFPWGPAQASGFRLRGRLLFAIGAELLGGDASQAVPAGEFWSLTDAALHCTSREARDYLLNEARLMRIPSTVPRNLRPLTVIAALAAENVRDRPSALRRVFTAAAHRLTGTMRGY